MKIFGIKQRPRREWPLGCYVYCYLIDGVPRYVGKGTGERCWDHMTDARAVIRARAVGQHIPLKTMRNRLADAISRGATIQIEVLVEGLTNEEACAFEAGTISFLGVTSLWNTGDAGTGLSSELARIVNADPVKRALAGAAIKKRHADPEVKKRHRDSLRKHWADPAAREARSELSKAIWTPDLRAAQAERLRTWWIGKPRKGRTPKPRTGLTPEGRQKRIDGVIAHNQARARDPIRTAACLSLNSAPVSARSSALRALRLALIFALIKRRRLAANQLRSAAGEGAG